MLSAAKESFFGGPTETKIDRIVAAIRNASTSRDKALHDLSELLNDPLGFTAEDFVVTNNRHNSVQKLMVYLLAFKKNAQDWNTDGYQIKAEAKGAYQPQWHHIFPQKWLKDNAPDTDKKLIDSVANMAIISAEANKKIAAKSPKTYIGELNLSARGLLDQQEIPDPSFVDPDKYEEWLHKRAERLALASNNYLADLKREF